MVLRLEIKYCLCELCHLFLWITLYTVTRRRKLCDSSMVQNLTHNMMFWLFRFMLLQYYLIKVLSWSLRSLGSLTCKIFNNTFLTYYNYNLWVSLAITHISCKYVTCGLCYHLTSYNVFKCSTQSFFFVIRNQVFIQKNSWLNEGECFIIIHNKL